MSQVKLQSPVKPDCCVGKLVAIAEPQGPNKPGCCEGKLVAIAEPQGPSKPDWCVVSLKLFESKLY